MKQYIKGWDISDILKNLDEDISSSNLMIEVIGHYEKEKRKYEKAKSIFYIIGFGNKKTAAIKFGVASEKTFPNRLKRIRESFNSEEVFAIAIHTKKALEIEKDIKSSIEEDSSLLFNKNGKITVTDENKVKRIITIPGYKETLNLSGIPVIKAAMRRHDIRALNSHRKTLELLFKELI